MRVLNNVLNSIPTYYCSRLLKRFELEDKVCEKISKEKLLNEEQKINAKSMIYGGLYDGAIIYIQGCKDATK